MMSNSYGFRKHSFGTNYWLTSDSGLSVRGISLELRKHLGCSGPSASCLRRIDHNVTIKAPYPSLWGTQVQAKCSYCQTLGNTESKI